jgi:glutamine phosphoribosylpyrophosphate amidotransferase
METIKRLFLESQIRGRHATGVSVLIDGHVETTVQPVPAEDFVKVFDFGKYGGISDFKLIGHCRYSTSDLRYNQPLSLSGQLSIAHNGVVTQDPPETWGRYGYSLETSNDSELILQSIAAGEEPLVAFPDASIAALELHSDGRMRWYRNGKRPMHISAVDNGCFITSTEDIAVRAGLSNSVKATPGVIYYPDKTATIGQVEELIL